MSGRWREGSGRGAEGNHLHAADKPTPPVAKGAVAPTVGWHGRVLVGAREYRAPALRLRLQLLVGGVRVAAKDAPVGRRQALARGPEHLARGGASTCIASSVVVVVVARRGRRRLLPLAVARALPPVTGRGCRPPCLSSRGLGRLAAQPRARTHAASPLFGLVGRALQRRCATRPASSRSKAEGDGRGAEVSAPASTAASAAAAAISAA